MERLARQQHRHRPPAHRTPRPHGRRCNHRRRRHPPQRPRTRPRLPIRHRQRRQQPLEIHQVRLNPIRPTQHLHLVRPHLHRLTRVRRDRRKTLSDDRVVMPDQHLTRPPPLRLPRQPSRPSAPPTPNQQALQKPLAKRICVILRGHPGVLSRDPVFLRSPASSHRPRPLLRRGGVSDPPVFRSIHTTSLYPFVASRSRLRGRPPLITPPAPRDTK